VRTESICPLSTNHKITSGRGNGTQKS